MQIINYGTETAPKWLAVATVSIKGEEQDIITGIHRLFY